jgi:hypothetical protein
MASLTVAEDAALKTYYHLQKTAAETRIAITILTPLSPLEKPVSA